MFNIYADFTYSSINLEFLVHTESLFVSIDLLKSPAIERKIIFLLIFLKKSI